MKGHALEYLLSRPLLVTPEALEAAVAVVTREGVPAAVEARKGTTADGAEAGMKTRGGVAVIPVTGPIFRYADWFTDLCGGATVEGLARDLRLALDNPAVRSILLSVDSPGGEAAGVGELAGMIRAADGVKPVCAYVGNQGCSAAYWLASAAGEVVCSDAAMLGSIGVVMGYTKRDDRPGTRSYEFVSSQSPNKRPDPDTETGRAEIQRVVDDLADVFLAAVAGYRKTTAGAVASDFGRGGMLVGAKAVDAGMADRLGTFEGVLSEMAGGSYRRPKTAAPSASPKGGSMFSFLFKPKADGTGFDVEPQPANPANPPATPKGVTEPAAPDPATAAASATAAELAAARTELAKAKVEVFQAKAETLYGELFAANLIVPAEKASLTDAFVQASMDDLTSPLAGGKTRVMAVGGIFKNRTPHTLTTERTASEGEAPEPANLPPGYKAVARAGASAAPSAARVAELAQHLVGAGMLGAETLADLKARAK